MKAYNVTHAQMLAALVAVNKRFSGNVQFNRFEPYRTHVVFTLRVADSHGPGAKRGFSGRHTVSACWHAHGYFFEELLRLAPEARIVTRGGPGAVITAKGGNWQDCNVGSQVHPMMFSEACACNE